MTPGKGEGVGWDRASHDPLQWGGCGEGQSQPVALAMGDVGWERASPDPLQWRGVCRVEGGSPDCCRGVMRAAMHSRLQGSPPLLWSVMWG